MILFVFIMELFIPSKIIGQNNNIKEKKQPNIIIILTDDQAFGDLSFTGNTIAESPIIDNLASEGVFATNFYVSPVCAPTRASLLTGRYHQSTGVSGVTRGAENMSLDEMTLADIFKSFGYNTGIFGKWHNGSHYPYHPLGRGFEEFVGFTSGHWTNYFNTTIEKNGKPFKTEGYLPDVLTNEAITFIEKSNLKNKPFLCYIPYNTPHTPLQVPDKYFDKYKKKGADDFNAAIYGMNENIDDNLGKILKKLDELNIRDNTIIIYLSDNGPLNYRFNTGLKGRKGMVDQGGVKVPFIINWKNHIPENKIIENSLSHIDILPTLIDLAEQNYHYKNKIDGVSFKKLLFQESDFTDRKLFAEWNGNKRVLYNNYLIINEELYDLDADTGQKTDIRNKHLDLYNTLSTAYENWFINLKQQKGTANIPAGYSDYPITILPAHEANLFPPFEFRKDRKSTGIAYHSLYGWAHDWIDFWTKTTAYITWNIDVVSAGEFQVAIKYALKKEDVGVQLLFQIDNQNLIIENLAPFEHQPLESFDRVERDQEAPETNWKLITIGNVHLQKGLQNIKLSSVKIPGNQSIEVKEIILSKKETL